MDACLCHSFLWVSQVSYNDLNHQLLLSTTITSPIINHYLHDPTAQLIITIIVDKYFLVKEVI